MSLIPAFNQIRLTNEFVTTSGQRVKVASDNTLMVRDSGNFANLPYVEAVSGVLVGQIAGATAGVASVNGLTGIVLIKATGGNLFTVEIGQTIWISGSGIAQAVDLTQTGISLLAIIANTGQAAWLAAQNNALNLSGIIETTGTSLYNLITALSGQADINYATKAQLTSLSGWADARFVPTGTILSFYTGLATGFDSLYINFLNYTFASIPRVVAQLETSESNIGYWHIISGRSVTGFWVGFSDTILETGLGLNVIAKS